MEVDNVGVVGAGVMGRGLAQALSQTGHQVILLDVSEGILARAEQEVRNNLRLQGLFHKGRHADNTDEVLRRIRLTTDYEDLCGADFVIENTTEKWEIKRDVYGLMDRICHERCVFAANTSAIPITRIASATRRPAQVIGA